MTEYNTSKPNLSSGGHQTHRKTMTPEAFRKAKDYDTDPWEDEEEDTPKPKGYGFDSLAVEDIKKQLGSEYYDLLRIMHPSEGRGDGLKGWQDSMKSAIKSALKDGSREEKIQRFWEFFEGYYQSRLRVNTWTGEYILSGHPTTIEKVLYRLEQALGMASPLSTDQLERKLKVMLESSEFNPVRHELEELSQKYREDLPEWDDLANILFGTNDQLSQTMLEKWLVAAVARALQPGCQADNALVLRGKQGIGKSTFFRVLAGDFYLSIKDGKRDVETLRQLNQAWIVELEEMEGILRKEDVESLKAFLTQVKDTYRGLYEKKPHNHPRHVVFGGSCNSHEILKDDTGNRRFWIVDCGDQDINHDFLKENRCQILATAYRKYIKGFPYWADREMTRQSEARNQSYVKPSVFQDKVDSIMEALEKQYPNGVAIKSTELAEFGLQIPVSQLQRGGTDREIAKALTARGYDKTQVSRQRAWCQLGCTKPSLVAPGAITQAFQNLENSHKAVVIELTPEASDTTRIVPEKKTKTRKPSAVTSTLPQPTGSVSSTEPDWTEEHL